MKINAEKKQAKRFVFTFFGQVAVLLFLCACFVVVIDPFFHYHKPITPLKAVVTKPEYQGIGTIRTFAYDSVIAGSSVAENYNNRWFDEKFGCTSIKAIKKSAMTSDLVYYLEEAYEYQELTHVFYSLDTVALLGDASKNFVDESMPLYLYNHNWIDDVKYVWNKDVIFEHAPYLVSVSILDDYDEGKSYNWAQYKTFSGVDTLSRYSRRAEVVPMQDKSAYETVIMENVDLLEELVKEHAQTQYVFVLPPYSMLWWDNSYREGMLDTYLYALECVAERLLPYQNVQMYFYQAEEAVVMNLDNYMDNVHFSEEINQWMVDELGQETYLLTQDNLQRTLHEMRELAMRMVEETDVAYAK